MHANTFPMTDSGSSEIDGPATSYRARVSRQLPWVIVTSYPRGATHPGASSQYWGLESRPRDGRHCHTTTQTTTQSMGPPSRFLSSYPTVLPPRLRFRIFPDTPLARRPLDPGSVSRSCDSIPHGFLEVVATAEHLSWSPPSTNASIRPRRLITVRSGRFPETSVPRLAHAVYDLVLRDAALTQLMSVEVRSKQLLDALARTLAS